MSLLIRQKADAPISTGFLLDYLAQYGTAPDTSTIPCLNPGLAVSGTPYMWTDTTTHLPRIIFVNDRLAIRIGNNNYILI